MSSLEATPLLMAQVIAAYNGYLPQPPTTGADTPLKVALFGSIIGPDWRAPFKAMGPWLRPVEFYDPRDTFTEGPEHFLEELRHLHDDIRVVAATDESYSFQSLRELGHLLTARLDAAPVVAYVAPEMNPSSGKGRELAYSNNLRGQLIGHMAVQAGHPNLYIAGSLDDAYDITYDLIAGRQALTTAE